jgi:isopentenyl-diphosphate Delta-isomerase
MVQSGPPGTVDARRAPGAAEECVVLLDEGRRPVGTAPKAGVHTAATPLHLAFSCHVLDREGRVLVTRRALSKATWPGVWTNSVCGHPGPDEEPAAAVPRRAHEELGLDLAAVTPLLPEFAYRAVDASGVVENEVCPVFAARACSDVVPDPAEVAEWAWVPWEDLVAAAGSAPWALSPWAVLQVRQMTDRGVRPADVLPPP